MFCCVLFVQIRISFKCKNSCKISKKIRICYTSFKNYFAQSLFMFIFGQVLKFGINVVILKNSLAKLSQNIQMPHVAEKARAQDYAFQTSLQEKVHSEATFTAKVTQHAVVLLTNNTKQLAFIMHIATSPSPLTLMFKVIYIYPKLRPPFSKMHLFLALLTVCSPPPPTHTLEESAGNIRKWRSV